MCKNSMYLTFYLHESMKIVNPSTAIYLENVDSLNLNGRNSNTLVLKKKKTRTVYLSIITSPACKKSPYLSKNVSYKS
jgi:hypothetical protein